MYALRGNVPDFTFEKKKKLRQKVTIWKGVSGNGILLRPDFYGNVNSGSNHVK